MKFLRTSATRVINEVKGVNRVVYDVKAAGDDRVGVGRRSAGNDANLAGQSPSAMCARELSLIASSALSKQRA
jgi:hypothetical protein